MFARLNRLIKRRVFRSDYRRMEAFAAAGDYYRAALIASILGERELQDRYENLRRQKLAAARTAPLPLAHRMLQKSLHTRRN